MADQSRTRRTPSGTRTTRSAVTGRFVSDENRRVAAQGFIKASRKTGQPVPDYIRRLAQED